MNPIIDSEFIHEERRNRRKLRLMQVAAQSNEMAARIRKRYTKRQQQEMNALEQLVKHQWEAEKAGRVERLNNRYLTALKHIGDGIEKAKLQPNELEEFRMRQAWSIGEGRKRGTIARKALKQRKEEEQRQKKAAQAPRKHARYVERMRAMKVAALPAPAPPDPPPTVRWGNELRNVNQKNGSTRQEVEEVEEEQPRIETIDPLAELNGKEQAEAIREEKKVVEENAAKQREVRRKEALARGRAAMKKEMIRRDYQHLIHELEQWEREGTAIKEPGPSTPESVMKDRRRKLEDEFERTYLSSAARNELDVHDMAKLESQISEYERNMEIAPDRNAQPNDSESTPSNDVIDGADIMSVRHLGISTTESSGWEMVDKTEYEKRRRDAAENQYRGLDQGHKGEDRDGQLLEGQHAEDNKNRFVGVPEEDKDQYFGATDVHLDQLMDIKTGADDDDEEDEYLIIEQEGSNYRFRTASSSGNSKKDDRNYDSKNMQSDLSAVLARLNSTEYLAAPFDAGKAKLSVMDLSKTVSEIEHRRHRLAASIDELRLKWDPDRSVFIRRCVAKLLVLRREEARTLASSTSSESTPLSQISRLSGARSLPSGTESFLSYAREFAENIKKQNGHRKGSRRRSLDLDRNHSENEFPSGNANFMKVSSPKLKPYLRRSSTPVLKSKEDNIPITANNVGVGKSYRVTQSLAGNKTDGEIDIDEGDIADLRSYNFIERGASAKLQKSGSLTESNISYGDLSPESITREGKSSAFGVGSPVRNVSELPQLGFRIPLDKNFSMSDISRGVLTHDEDLWRGLNQKINGLNSEPENIRFLESNWKRFSNSQVIGKSKLSSKSVSMQPLAYDDEELEIPKPVKKRSEEVVLGDSSAIYNGLRRLLEDLQNKSQSLERENKCSTSSSSKGNSLSKSYQSDVGDSAYRLSGLSLDSVSSFDTVTPDVSYSVS